MLNTHSLVWGVRAFYDDKYESSDVTIRDIKNYLKQIELLKSGEIVVNVFSTPLEEKGMANTIKLNVI
jgi:pyruvate kinase